MNKREFVLKFGDPIYMGFDGQVWDTRTAAGGSGHKLCDVHRHPIRFCFLIKLYEYGTPTRKLEVGPCCIPLFKRWNRVLYKALYRAYRSELISRAMQRVDRQLIRDKMGKISG